MSTAPRLSTTTEGSNWTLALGTPQPYQLDSVDNDSFSHEMFHSYFTQWLHE